MNPNLALNVCLMATAYGIRGLGPANPSHYERLKKYAMLARKRGREVEKADLEGVSAPASRRYAPMKRLTGLRRHVVSRWIVACSGPAYNLG